MIPPCKARRPAGEIKDVLMLRLPPVALKIVPAGPAVRSHSLQLTSDGSAAPLVVNLSS